MKSRRCAALLILFSASLVQLAFPPFGVGWVVFFALVPALLAVESLSLFNKAFCGVLIGLSGYVQLPFSLAGWGDEIFLGAWLITGVLFCGFFVLSHYLNKYLPATAQWLSYPVAWLVTYWCASHGFKAPVSLAVPLALVYPEFLQQGQYLGHYAMEFIIVALNTLLAISIRQRSALPLLGSVGLILTPVLTFFVSSPNAAGSVQIAALQPAFSANDHRSATWSLGARHRQEETLDSLTEQAIRLKPDIVVWPEGGNNLFNTRVRRRIDKVNSLLQGYDGVFLMAGKDLNAQGEQYNIVSVYESGKFIKNIQKVYTAPFAESILHAGHADIVATRFGNLGIMVCMDAIFLDYFAVLAEKASDIFIVVADGSSFGYGSLSKLHAAYALAGAIYAGRPLIFLNNNGISFSADSSGHINDIDHSGTRAGIYRFAANTPLDKNSKPVIAIRIAFTTLLLLCTVFGFLSGAKPIHLHFGTRLYRWFPITALSLMLGTGFVAFIRSLDMKPIDALNFMVSQRYLDTAMDGVAPLYMQANNNTCGASALAYLMTLLGDYIFPEDILAMPATNHDLGYSMSELKHIAESRGFSADGFHGAWNDLPSVGEPPVLMHLTEQHYIVGLGRSGNLFLYFDPALGKLVSTKRSEIEHVWSGNFLRVLTK